MSGELVDGTGRTWRPAPGADPAGAAVPYAGTDAPDGDPEPAGGGWPDAVGETALSLRVPCADPLVTTGSAAHVTVVYPFLPASRLTRPVRAEVAALFAGHAGFDLVFSCFGHYPGVLWLAPEPAAPVRALTRAVLRRWPELRPYRGLFGDGLEPHLTVAVDDGPVPDPSALRAREARLTPLLPLRARVTGVQLAEFDGASWQERDVFPLRAPTAASGAPGAVPVPRTAPGTAGRAVPRA